MKKTMKLLSDVGFWGLLVSIVSLVGLAIADDVKSIMVFGFIYIGACIQIRR